MNINPGARVNHYLLTKPLAKGGQGSVWEAFAVEGSQAPRALKLIDLRGVDRDKAERAWREAQALHDVTHPGLVPCREFFRDSDTGLMGLVFDLVPGQTLFAAARDPRMTSEYKFAILDQLAAILAYVHALGIVHRDLKPANVLVTDAFWSAPRVLGGVKLVDFGISVRAGNPTPVTNPGSVVGTIPYLPPDLVCPGQWPLDREGFARDVFAFGIMGWELILGQHPTGLSPDALLAVFADVYREAHLQRRPWPPSSSNEPWMIALRACLALDPQSRPSHGAAILDIVRTGHFAPKIPTERHAGPTAVHVAPTPPPLTMRSGQTPLQLTESSRGSVSTPSYVPSTAPMPYQGAPMPHVPSPPSHGTAANNGGSWRWVGYFMAAALGAFALWLFAFPKNGPSTDSTVIPIPSSTANTLPVRPESVAPSKASEIIPCCNEHKTCSSGRSCTAGGCLDEALPERTWALRVTGALDTVKNEDLAGSHPNGTVCMRNDRSGETICAPMSRIVVEGGDRVNMLHATTGDLKYGRITVWVTEGATTIYPATPIADNRDGIKMSILCPGMRLRVGPRHSAPLHVFVFLD